MSRHQGIQDSLKVLPGSEKSQPWNSQVTYFAKVPRCSQRDSPKVWHHREPSDSRVGILSDLSRYVNDKSQYLPLWTKGPLKQGLPTDSFSLVNKKSYPCWRSPVFSARKPWTQISYLMKAQHPMQKYHKIHLSIPIPSQKTVASTNTRSRRSLETTFGIESDTSPRDSVSQGPKRGPMVMTNVAMENGWKWPIEIDDLSLKKRWSPIAPLNNQRVVLKCKRLMFSLSRLFERRHQVRMQQLNS